MNGDETRTADTVRKPAAPPPPHIKDGDRLGRYTIVGRIGAGGMGEVYRAADSRLGRSVAIKVIGGASSGSESARYRFEQEARAASALNHPNIVTIFDISQEGATPFIVMELLEGESLRHILREPLPIEALVRFAIQIADALGAVHARGIVHRDLKPENVFITTEGAAKLLDFGVAQFRLQSETAAGGDERGAVVMGTTGYIAPEVIAGEPADMRADLFAFGCILYEMACGSRPFARSNGSNELVATLNEAPPAVLSRRPDLPPELARLIEDCLAKDPEERPPSARAIRNAILDLPLSGGGDAVADTTAPAIPTPATDMVGREEELARIRTVVFEEKARLVTLTGPGGSGKTRLAIAAAHNLLGAFGGRISFVELASLHDREGVAAAIAHRIGSAKSARTPLAGAIRKLQSTGDPVMLILDNFEHVLDAAAVVSELLAACPNLTILVTSREILRVYGEHDIPVPPLALPAPDDDIRASLANPAVTLFTNRATASSSGFRLTPDNVGAVVALCRRLDGLPLALELAAARVRLLTPQAILARLDDPLSLLTGGPRDRPERQQTLRNTIHWSHDLLSPDEQVLFRRLSVFVNGFTLESAEAVGDPHGRLATGIIEGVSSLADKSLLVRRAAEDGEPRFAMLETIREYAAERLLESAERDDARKAHAAYFLVLAEEGAAALASAENPRWLATLAREHDDILSALDWLIGAKNAEWGLRLAVAMFRFWERGEHLTEARHRLAELLALTSAHDENLRGRALFASAMLASAQFDDHAGAGMFRQSLHLHRQTGNRLGVAIASNSLGICLTRLRAFDEAAAVIEDSLAVWQELGDRASFARSLSNLAFVRKSQRRFDEAHELYARCVQLFADLGDRASSAWALNHQGDVAREQRAPDADALYDSALDAFRSLGDAWGIASCLADLGLLARDRHELDRAATLFDESLTHFAALGHQRGIARLLEAIAILSIDSADYARALTLAGAASRLRESLGSQGTETDHAGFAATLESARSALGEKEARQAWNTGRIMSQRDAINFARRRS